MFNFNVRLILQNHPQEILGHILDRYQPHIGTVEVCEMLPDLLEQGLTRWLHHKIQGFSIGREDGSLADKRAMVVEQKPGKRCKQRENQDPIDEPPMDDPGEGETDQGTPEDEQWEMQAAIVRLPLQKEAEQDECRRQGQRIRHHGRRPAEVPEAKDHE
jgi:hypothetical protein